MLGDLLNSYQQTESFGIVRFAQDAKGRCPLGLQSTQRPSTQRTQQRASHKLLSPPKSNNTPNTCLALSSETVSHYGIVWGERSSKNCEQSSSLIGGWFCRQLARPQNQPQSGLEKTSKLTSKWARKAPSELAKPLEQFFSWEGSFRSRDNKILQTTISLHWEYCISNVVCINHEVLYIHTMWESCGDIDLSWR